jgi:flavin reductase (DIM6/NTAB) family NADH-FMN oxidoreductase RutF
MICTVAGKVTAGDHTIVLCSPLSAEQSAGHPLLYHRSAYKGF